jgi:hypothetical protein
MGSLALSLTTFAQAVSQKPRVADEPSLVTPWMMAIIVLLLIGLPFLLGALIARWLKVKDLALRIGVVLFAFLLGMSKIGGQYVMGYLEQRKYDQDLAVWEERQAARDTIKPQTLDELKKAVPGLDVRFENQKPAAKSVANQ